MTNQEIIKELEHATETRVIELDYVERCRDHFLSPDVNVRLNVVNYFREIGTDKNVYDEVSDAFAVALGEEKNMGVLHSILEAITYIGKLDSPLRVALKSLAQKTECLYNEIESVLEELNDIS